jgi:diguanylate cyclase (GGDEF)-like protein/PAS domain S-box-containing protein
MLYAYMTGIALIFTFLFIASQLFKKETLYPARSAAIQIKIGLVHGIMCMAMMLFSVQANATMILDMRNIFIILAAHMGGMFSAILAAVFVLLSHNLIFGGITQASITSSIGVFVVALGAGFISGSNRPYWIKWLYNYLLIAVVISIAVIYLMGPFSSLFLPYFLGALLLGCTVVASFLRFLMKTNEKINLNEFMTPFSSKLHLSESSQDLLEVTLKELVSLFDIDSGSVIMTDKNQHKIMFSYSNGTYKRENRSAGLQDLKIMAIISKGEVALFPEWNKRRPRGSEAESMYELGVRSSLHLPILYKEQVISFITLGSKKNGYFSSREVSILNKLAPMLNLAIAFKDTEGKFTSVFDSSLDAIIVLTSDHYIVMWNEGAEKLYYYTVQEAVGQHISLLIPPKLFDINRANYGEFNLEYSLNRHLNKTTEFLALRKDGSEVSIEVSWNGWQTGGSHYISIISRDMTERKQNELEISSLKQELAETLNQQQGMITKFKKQGNQFIYTLAEGQLLYQLELSPEKVVGKSIQDTAPPHLQEFLFQQYERAWKGERFHYEFNFGPYVCMSTLNPIFKDGQVVEVISTSSNITHLKKLERELLESEERYRRLIELLPDGVLIHNKGAIIMANPKAAELLHAASPSELLRYPIASLLYEDSQEIVSGYNPYIYDTQSDLPPTERVFLRLDGRPIHVEVASTWMAYNGIPSIMITFRDITARKTAEQKLHEANEMFKRLSAVDGLTSIANRRCMEERYELEWNQALTDLAMLSILIIDIDSFKLYNDTYGHQGGDACLKQVATTLDQLAQANGYFAARFGGEEFVCILPQISKADALSFAEEARATIERLGIPHLHSPFDNKVTVSAGIASILPVAFLDKKELIEQADKALYQAKISGRNRVCIYKRA